MQTEKGIQSIPLPKVIGTEALKLTSSIEGTQGVIDKDERAEYKDQNDNKISKGKVVHQEPVIAIKSTNRFDVLQMNETETLQGNAGPSSFSQT